MREWGLKFFFYFILEEVRLCKILEVYDSECAGNLILILGLEMENTGCNLNIFKVFK